MTDILYVVGGGSAQSDNLPLRWSLRSLEKYADGVGRVIVAGMPPHWLSGEVVKIPVPDVRRGKHWNILNCIVTAVSAAGLDRPFLYSSDDHYLCRSVNLDAWPRFSRGSLYTFEEYAESRKSLPGSYQMSLIATRRLLQSTGLSLRRACCHMNTWMDPRYAVEVANLAKRHAVLSPYGFEPTCLFNALFERDNPHASYTEITDAVDRKVSSPEDIAAKIASGAVAFSTTPRAESTPSVIAAMNALYPEPCRYEAVLTRRQ